MGRNFKYKDFVNKLRFQVGGVCPEEFSELGEKYIKKSVYSHALKAATALYKEPTISVSECETITQIIAEWTFHKTIDLMNGEIPEVFHDRILNKINEAIYELLIDEGRNGEINDDSFTIIEEIVKDTYRDELRQLYSDKGICKDVYKWAVSQSHIDDVIKDVSSGDGVKEDKFYSHSRKITFKDVFLADKFMLCLYAVSIIIYLFVLISSAQLGSRVVFAILGFTILLIIGLCRRIFLTLNKIAFDNAQEIEDKQDILNATNPNTMYERLGVDIISMQTGLALVPICDPDAKNKLLPAIAKLRKTLTDELGYIIPNVRAMDNKKLKPNECKIYIRGALRDSFMVDIQKANAHEFIIKHLRKCCIKYVNDIFSKTDVLKLVELTRSQDPTLVNDLIPELISAIDFRRIMVNLIREEVPVKDIILIFERLCDFARFNKEPYVLSERLRAEMGALICMNNSIVVNDEATLYAGTFSSECEDLLLNAVIHTELGVMLKLEPNKIEDLVTSVKTFIGNLEDNTKSAVILVPPRIRLPLYGLLSMYIEDIKIMSFAELTTEIKVEQIGQINF